MAIYSTVDTFPKADANASYHDTFLRYKTLTNIISNHKGKFTHQDMIDTLRTVYAETNDQVLFKERALKVNMPERTTTNSLVDVTNGTISARFYLREGAADPMLGGPSNVFSQFFNLHLVDHEAGDFHFFFGRGENSFQSCVRGFHPSHILTSIYQYLLSVFQLLKPRYCIGN